MIEVKRLLKIYKSAKTAKCAVKEASFTIQRGEVLGLVGESGSGKSTLGKMLLGLIPPTSGEIFFDGEAIGRCIEKRVRRRMQMIFQDPSASLNPRMTVAHLIEEPLKIHNLPGSIDELLTLVGLPVEAKWRYPHEFSGGQKQRIAIARAIALKPEFLVCDEPLSALDVSIQAQIVNLLMRLQKELKLTYLFISHDLNMVRYVSHRVAVMQEGEIVEIGPSDAVYSSPQHPYTKKLLASIHQIDFIDPSPKKIKIICSKR